ncbi:MAG: serpin family protein [Eubacterium sp.]|nr:serpin family protein [Eubacterium sp.]
MNSLSLRRRLFVFAAVLALLLTCSAPLTESAVQAASAGSQKVSLSKKKMTLKTGKTKTLKVKGAGKTVKWTVSGKKLVTIKKKSGKYGQTAVIKAGKKTGTCYVRAKVGKKTYKCKVVVKKASAAAAAPAPAGKVKIKSAYVKAIANTSVQLLQKSIAYDESKGNILISPDSILTALSIVENGAAGKTLTEMKTALGGISETKYSKYLTSLHKRVDAPDSVAYKVANSIWYKEGEQTIKDSFLKKIQNYDGAELYKAPFSQKTVDDINAWVSEKTNGKIPSIIQQLSPEMRTAVINAVWFKGAWADPYSDTVKRTFTNENGSKKRVNDLEGTEHAYVTVNGADGFVKPYSGGTTAFLALLPPKDKTVDQFIKSLSGEDLVTAYLNRVTEDIIVQTRMPEFSYDYSCSMTKPLKKLGIKTAFSGAADFSRMASPSICIDDVLHKTHIELNKDGTEAAAVTAIMMKASAAFPARQPTIKKVYLNRPFVYAIIDTETGLPLFIGAVRNL